MTQDEIIEMARQSGFLINELHCSPPIFSFVGQEESMQAFAKLVAEKVSRELAKECAGSGEWNAVHIIEAIRW